MPDLSAPPKPGPLDRVVGMIVDTLRAAGARPLANLLLRLLRLERRDEAAVPPAPPPRPALPAGPYRVEADALAPALLLFVPRSVRGRLIDGVTGGYGYSHLAVDLGEVDVATGKRVMIESAPGRPVGHFFQDAYGARPFARVPLAGTGVDLPAFSAGILAKVGQAYDSLEALTWGEVDDPARQICSDLAAVCLPRAMLEDIVARYAAGRLPRRSVSPHHVGTPAFHAFVSPNAFAAYFGVPPGERLAGANQQFVPADPRQGRRTNSAAGKPRPLRAELIYNPAAGSEGTTDARLTQILAEMQRWEILPEVHVVTPLSDVSAVAAHALRRGIRLVVVAGGDGTIDNVVSALVGRDARLGIIPIGTRNNVALSLGIPAGDCAAAVALLRAGRMARVDVGRAVCNGTARWFLETCTVGLAASLYSAADDLQHGDLARIGDLFTTFVSAAPSEIRLTLDAGRQVLAGQGHLVLLANMPYFGAHFQPAAGVAYDDGRLDALVFGGLNKIDLLGYAVHVAGGPVDDPRVAHYHCRSVEVRSEPSMPVMADGVMLGSGGVRVTLHARALKVMAGHTAGLVEL